MNTKELHSSFSCHADSMTDASLKEWPVRKVRIISTLILFMTASWAWAQPNGTGTYYQSADGNKGKNLKTALYEIIKSPNVKSYSALFECYKSTDLRPDGKIWDMYSNITNFDPDKDHSGNYSGEGDMFNREHSFPKSWFGNVAPMNSDLFHVIPTDGYVNNRRSNYPFGETNGESYKSNGGFSKVGSCTTNGYSGTVFEPNDEYKGDFARIYFYMVTCYESKV
ncbi:MAG: endonuclease, partial [Prevotella sp.]